jgi:hypothetical protein
MPDRHPWEREEPRLYEPFPKAASTLLQNRLRVLDIPKTNSWKSLTTYNLKLRSFLGLVRLSLPMDALIDPDGQPTTLVEVIPPKLESLQIRPCSKYVQPWISGLRQARTSAEFPLWRQLDLFFDSCIRTALLLIDQGSDMLSTFSKDVALLFQTGLTVGYFHGSNKQQCNDLIEELDAHSNLSYLEAWFAPSKEQNFSAVVARTDSGTPRRRTRPEIRSFLRDGQTPAKRRRISRFTPRVCLGGTPRLKFEIKKEDPTLPLRCAPTVEAWEKSYASYEGPMSTAARTPLAPISLNPPTAARQAYDFATFERSLTLPEPVALNAAFDRNEWDGVCFFVPLKSSPTVGGQSQRMSRKNIARPASKLRSSTPRPRRLKQKVS